MALAPTCLICGTRHFSTQVCPAREQTKVVAARTPQRSSAEKPKKQSKAHEKISAGPNEAIAVAKGERKPARVTAFLGIRLEDDVLDALDVEAKRLGVKKSEAARAILKKALMK